MGKLWESRLIDSIKVAAYFESKFFAVHRKAIYKNIGEMLKAKFKDDNLDECIISTKACRNYMGKAICVPRRMQVSFLREMCEQGIIEFVNKQNIKLLL